MATLLENKEMLKNEFYIIFTKGDILLKNIEKKFGLYELTSMGFNGNYNFNNVIEFHKNAVKNFVNEITFIEVDGIVEQKPKEINFFVINNVNDKKETRKMFFNLLETISNKGIIYK
jgi:uncharacterized protein YggL (DUF469 family)